MGIQRYLTTAVSGLVFAGLVLMAGPAAAAAAAAPCAGGVTAASQQAAPGDLRLGCRWKCSKRSHGKCTQKVWVCGGAGGGGGGGGGGSATNTNTININNQNINQSSSR